MVVNAGAISTIKRPMMPTTMNSSSNVKARVLFAFTGVLSELSRW